MTAGSASAERAHSTSSSRSTDARSCARLVALCLALATLILPRGAWGDSRAALSAGLRCYEQLSYRCAIKRLREALSAESTLSPKERFDAYKTLAFSLAAMDQEKQASEAFRKALALDGSLQLDPKVVAPRIYRAYRVALERHLQARERPLPPLRWPSPRSLTIPLVPPTPQLMIRRGFVRRPSPRESLIGLELGVEAGALFLFGGDHDLYQHGGGLALRIGFRPAEAWLVGLLVHQSFHRATSELSSSLENAGSTTLLLLRLHLLGAWRFLERGAFTLDAELAIGVALFGLGNVSGNVGFSGSLGLAAGYRVTRAISLVARISPTLLSAQNRGSEGGGFQHSLLLSLSLGADFAF